MPSARLLVWAAVGVVVVGLGAALFGFIGVATGASALDVDRAVWGRTALTLIGLALLHYVVVRQAPSAPVWLWWGTAVGAFFVDPLTWTVGADAGGALFGRHVSGSASAGLLIDAVVWLAVAAGVTLLAARSAREGPDRTRQLR